MPSGSLKTLGKSSVDKSAGNSFMKNVWEGLQNFSNTDQTLTRAEAQEVTPSQPTQSNGAASTETNATATQGSNGYVQSGTF